MPRLPIPPAALFAPLMALATAGCGLADVPGAPPTRVEETFVTRAAYFSNLDSPVVWHGPIDQDWLITTAKSPNRLYVHDAATGELLGRVGGGGRGPVEFRRPNGIALVDDLLLVVERDNARVQVLRLPAFDFVMSFGEGSLRRPYGIAVLRRGPATVDVFITDDYDPAAAAAAGPLGLGERVKRYRLELPGSGDGAGSATLLGSFGETAGPGRLLVVESLAVDPEARLLLVADEEAGDVKVYDVDGAFTGTVLWRDVIRHEPEGIVLYPCDGGDGYWILADQHRVHNRFLVFDRRDFTPLGAFAGATVRNTDGLAMTQRPVGSMPAGVLYAVHADRAVGAFSWRHVAAALGLRDDCGPAAGPLPPTRNP
ncbi:MAG TPA: hypothetical protein VMM12_00995 [Longimicrobiales bacterium]|nr:hypothetical protein [Longimicrobiales bacterium]